MAAARPDPEQVEGLDPQHYPDDPRVRRAPPRPPVPSSGATASRPPSTAPGPRLDASGFFENGDRWSAIANKKGNFGFHRSTVAEYSTTMRTADGTGSGYARFGSPRLSDHRPGRPRRARREQGRIVGTAARPAPGRVHRDPRARGRRRSADVPDLLAQRPLRRRGPQLPLEARRRHPPGREALRRRRDPALRPVRPAQPRQRPGSAAAGGGFGSAVRRRRDCRPARPPGSRTASSRPSPLTATGRTRPRSSRSRSPAA